MKKKDSFFIGTKLKNKFFGTKNTKNNRYKKLDKELATHYANSRKLTQQQLIDDLSTFSCESSPLISIVGSSRKTNNPHFGLPYFFASLLEMTADISNIEVVIRLDDNDDLASYYSIKTKFGSLIRMRFVIDKTINGYRNLFALNSCAFEHTTPTSCIVYLFTDDATFRKKNWDSYFLGFARSHKDNIFIINTSNEHIIDYVDKFNVLWNLWSRGPTVCLPAVGRRVMNIIKNIADKYPGWTVYGNNVASDSFYEALQYYCFEISGKRPPLAMMPYSLFMDMDEIIPTHKEGGLNSDSPVWVDAFNVFLANETQAVIKEMSQALCNVQGIEDISTRQRLEQPFAPTQAGNQVVISIIAKTYKENLQPGFYDQFLQSLVQHTEQLSRVEIIFVMTDQTPYYQKITENYGDKIRISLVHANPTKKNGLSIIDEEMLERLAPNSKMVCLANEAVIFSKPNWDHEIVSFSQKFQDEIFFINTHTSCTTNYDEKAIYFWKMLRSYYPGFSHIISRRIIENCYKYVGSRLINVTNEYRLDYLFIGAVQYYLWEMTKEKRTKDIYDLFITHKEYKPENPVNIPEEAFHDFMKPNVQDLFQKVAAALAKLTEKINTINTNYVI